MRAAVVRAFGPPENIAIEERPAPIPGLGEVVASVDAAGVNFADLLMVAGTYQVKPPTPFVPGVEFCGTIRAVGRGVERWRPGDRVMGAPLGGGCFAEHVAVPASQIFPAPRSLPDELAAQFVVAYGTAAYALKCARLAPGETLLVSGAGGGVGIAAVDLAARMGAHVIAAAGSSAKLRAASAHGAQALLDYTTQAVRETVLELTQGRGVQVVLDTVGGAFFDQALRSTARHGRLLVVGFASGSIPRVPAERLLLKNLSMLGIGFGGVLAAEPATVEAVLKDILALHAERPFVPRISSRFALADTAAALRHLAERDVVGKALIVPALDAAQQRGPRQSAA